MEYPNPMSLLIYLLIVLIVLSLVIYAIDLLLPGDARIKLIAKGVAVVLAILAVVQRAGLV